MKPIEIIRGGWFVLCATGAFVGTVFPATVVAAAILLGMILLVHAADERYPRVAWPGVMRRFIDEHRLDPAYALFAALFALQGLSRVSDGNPAGAFELMFVVYAVITFAAPRPTPVPVTE